VPLRFVLAHVFGQQRRLVIAARFADGMEVPIRLAEDEDAA